MLSEKFMDFRLLGHEFATVIRLSKFEPFQASILKQ